MVRGQWPVVRDLVVPNGKRETENEKRMEWDDFEDLGLALAEKYPEQNPLEVRFTDLHRWVTELPEFADDPAASNEGKLERIQMAWYEEWLERHNG